MGGDIAVIKVECLGVPGEAHTVELTYTLKARNEFFDNYESWWGVFESAVRHTVSTTVLDALMFEYRDVMLDLVFGNASAAATTSTSIGLPEPVSVVVTRVSSTVIAPDAYERYKLMRSTERL